MAPARQRAGTATADEELTDESEPTKAASDDYVGTVVCISGHPVDLHDGRSLAHGETAEGVDLNHPHNRALVLDGHVIVTEGKEPRTPVTKDQTSDLKAKAAERRRIARDAASGQFVTPATAAENPATTVTEEVS